jgi:hypothetical protein
LNALVMRSFRQFQEDAQAVVRCVPKAFIEISSYTVTVYERARLVRCSNALWAMATAPR